MFGDKVLTDVAENIRKLFRSSDILGRFGGDEFVILLKNVSDINFVEERANSLNEALRIKYREGEVELEISASVGVSIFPSDAGNYANLLRKSDEALYKAKQNGKDRFVLYST